MRIQQLLPLCGLVLASVAIASKLDHDDVPNRCWPACGPVVGISKSCDAQHERDSAEIQCICDWDAAKTQIPLCSACITQYQTDRRNHNITHNDHDDDDHDDDDHDDDNDDDNEALDLVHSCSFTTTTYNSAATTVTGTSTTTDTSSPTTSNGATGTDSSSTSGTNSQDSTTSVSSGSSDSASASSGSASSPTPTPGAAASISAPGAASVAGAMGLMAFAWL